MKVQQLQQQTSIQFNDKPQFKGAVDTGLRFLATNQAVGANGVDFCFMVVPRTASDGVKRGPASGLETFRREIMGTVNDSCIGLFGAIAGSLIAYGINKKFGLNVNKMFTAPETLSILAENRANQLKNKKQQVDYIKETLSAVKAYNPTAANSDKDGFVKLSQKTIDKVAKVIDKELQTTDKDAINKWTDSSSKSVRSAVMNMMIGDTGAESKYILESADKKIASQTNLKSLLNDIYIVTSAFNRDKIKSSFQEQIKNNKGIKDNAFIKGMSKFMKTRAGLGFAIASVIGLSVQPVNMYLTKLKTGSDGFVGVEGRSKDNSAGFMGMKTLSSAAFFSMILSTLNIAPWKFTPRKFMDKMAFTGKMPTINQLKGLYGITIISRIFSARDKDELREVLTKDTLGYLSWLVLGDIVNRMVAAKLDDKVMNYKKGTEKASYFKKMFNASLKTRDEILVQTLEKHGIDTTKKENGKIAAKSFKEMLKELKNNPKISASVRKATRKHLNTLNGAQVAGYLFSGLVLGLGIPNLNIYITNKLDKKRKAEAARKAQEEQKLTA